MSTSDDVLIKVENVSKKSCRSLNRSMLYGTRFVGCGEARTASIATDAHRRTAHPTHSDKSRKDEFWAVDDVSFEVKRGECSSRSHAPAWECILPLCSSHIWIPTETVGTRKKFCRSLKRSMFYGINRDRCASLSLSASYEHVSFPHSRAHCYTHPYVSHVIPAGIAGIQVTWMYLACHPWHWNPLPGSYDETYV